MYTVINRYKCIVFGVVCRTNTSYNLEVIGGLGITCFVLYTYLIISWNILLEYLFMFTRFSVLLRKLLLSNYL